MADRKVCDRPIRDRAAASLAWLVATMLATGNAKARVQEYQIIRLINYKTACQLAKLEDRSAAKGPMRFFASCDNVSFYPDGIDIVCDDRDDDRSCHVLTKEKTFDQLDLLKPEK